MMQNPFGGMYLRQGDLWKDFQVMEKQTGVVDGYAETGFTATGKHLYGILAEADSNLSDRMKHRWDQDQHSLTHTLIVRGRADVKKGDRLVFEEKGFLVLLNDDVGILGVSGIIYLEERNDVK